MPSYHLGPTTPYWILFSLCVRAQTQTIKRALHEEKREHFDILSEIVFSNYILIYPFLIRGNKLEI
jgi:hypothetical protein